MNNYSERSQYYQYEFITKDDFPLIRYVLQMGNGPVIEIPCGSGRLLDLHSEHKREVYMVDLESRMIDHCKKNILVKGLESRVSAIIGNMINWYSPIKVELVMIPRGGLQLLRSRDEIKATLYNANKNLASRGIIYIDIADPWNASVENLDLLPEFMRFIESRVLEGSSQFNIDGNNILSRRYISELHENHITVQFKYEANSSIRTEYGGTYQWLHISVNNLRDDLTSAGFEVLNVYSNYLFGDHQPGASRIICLAQKKD